MIREKDLSHDDRVDLVRDVVGVCREAGALVLVNHDVEAALEAGADGVHLGFQSVSVPAARAAAAGAPLLVGRSTHDLAELTEARDAGADYVTFGPVHDTPSKRGLLEPRGYAALRAAVEAAEAPDHLPVLALGGLTYEHAAAVRATGACGLAAVRALLAVDDETEAALRLTAAWDGEPTDDDHPRPGTSGA